MDMSIASLADDEILRIDRRNLDLKRVIDPHLGPAIAKLQLNAVQSAQLADALKPVAEESPIENTPPSTALDACEIYPD
jgi:hypothetical protein